MQTSTTELEKERLEGWIREIAVSREHGDDARVEQLKIEIQNFASFDDDLNTLAHQAFVAASVTDLLEATTELKNIADGLSGAKEALERSRALAESGEKELVIPRVATASERILDEVKTLEAGVRSLIDAGENIDGAANLAAFLDAAITQIESVRNSARSITF